MVCGKSFNRNQLSWMEMTHEFTEEINVHSKSMLSTIDTLDTEEAIALRRSFSEHKKKIFNFPTISATLIILDIFCLPTGKDANTGQSLSSSVQSLLTWGVLSLWEKSHRDEVC